MIRDDKEISGRYRWIVVDWFWIDREVGRVLGVQWQVDGPEQSTRDRETND